jgi:hypothetical protein
MDKDDAVQGPFENSLMHEWFLSGFLLPSLCMARVSGGTPGSATSGAAETEFKTIKTWFGPSFTDTAFVQWPAAC